jgi:hypothetical protein
MVQAERAEWTQVLCDVNATRAKVTQVEQALRARGYRVRIDGDIDDDVLTRTIAVYQRCSGLPASGLMSAETLAKLGVPLK